MNLFSKINGVINKTIYYDSSPCIRGFLFRVMTFLQKIEVEQWKNRGPLRWIHL